MAEIDTDALLQALGAGGNTGSASAPVAEPIVDPLSIPASERGQFTADLINNRPKITGAQLGALNDAVEQAETARGNVEQDRLVLSKVNELLDLSDDGSIPGFGAIDNLFVNPREAERGAIGNLVAGVRSAASENYGRAATIRNFLLSNDYREAYDSLRGGGHITEFEGKTVAASISELSSPTLTDEAAIAELQRIQSALSKAIQRDTMGISTNAQGQEFRDNGSGELEQVFSYMKDGKLVIEPTGGRDVFTIPSFFTQEQKQALYDQIPDGAIFVMERDDGSVTSSVKGQ